LLLIYILFNQPTLLELLQLMPGPKNEPAAITGVVLERH